MPSALVITDGSLAALVAAAAERDRGVDVVAWVPPGGSGLSAAGFECSDAASLVRHQAALLGFEHVIERSSPVEEPDAADARLHGLRITSLLVEAVAAAGSHGCARVIWPLAAGDDLSAMAWADERADLVTRLTMLDEESGLGRAVEIVLPLVDLTPAQIDDLAADLDVPRHLAHAPSQAPAGA